MDIVNKNCSRVNTENKSIAPYIQCQHKADTISGVIFPSKPKGDTNTK